MTHINQRRDISTNWTFDNPVLMLGEIGWETDTLNAKLGDGTTPWNSLPYVISTPAAPPVTSVAGKTGTVTLVKADVGLSNVDNTSDMNKPISTATQAALNAKTPINNPVFTGDPQAPTPLAGDNDTSIATTAFVMSAGVVLPGMIVEYGGSTAPAGWAICDGSSQLRTDPDYAALFSAIGTAFGAVDGTHFNLPDLRTKFPRGVGTGIALASTGGSTTHTHALSANGQAKLMLNDATNTIYGRMDTVSSWTANRVFTATGQSVGTSSSSLTQAAELMGTTDSAAQVPPYQAVNFLIKL